MDARLDLDKSGSCHNFPCEAIWGTLMLDSGVLFCNMAQGSQLNVKTLEK
jgi:hypothetical protein